MAIKPDTSRSRISTAISRLVPRLENVTQIDNSLRRNDRFDCILTIIAVLPIYRTIIQLKRNRATYSAAVINCDLTLESNRNWHGAVAQENILWVIPMEGLIATVADDLQS